MGWLLDERLKARLRRIEDSDLRAAVEGVADALNDLLDQAEKSSDASEERRQRIEELERELAEVKSAESAA